MTIPLNMKQIRSGIHFLYVKYDFKIRVANLKKSSVINFKNNLVDRCYSNDRGEKFKYWMLE